MAADIESHPEKWAESGFIEARRLPGGMVAAVGPMLFTFALFVDVRDECHDDFYSHRYCYRTAEEALIALRNWDGEGDPPGLWVVRKPGDRRNPLLLEEYAS